jgi:Flp pilus assembly protein TadD
MVKSLVDQLFEKGMQHQRAGRLREAESVYRQVLAQRPNEPDALHLLAVVQFQSFPPRMDALTSWAHR